MRGVLAFVTPPKDWRNRRFGVIAVRVRESGRPDLEPLSVYLDAGVVPRASRDDNYNTLGEDLSKYLVVAPNDLVFNKLRTWQGGFGMSSFRGIVSPAYFVCRTSADVEPRYLDYLLHSVAWLQELTRVSKWMPPSQFDIGWEQLRDVPILLPRLRVQREIAEFLDAETARIDALIEKKRRMVRLLRERLRGMVMSELFGVRAPWIRVGRLVDLLPGFAFSSDLFSTDASGVRLLRGINVAPGRTRWDETVYLEPSRVREVQRFALTVGDLVIGMDRPVIGGGMRVAEIAESDVPCLLVQRVARVRVNALAERDWIRLALMSPAFVAYFYPIVTGVSVPHISPDQIASFQVPLPDREKQRSILRQLLMAERINEELSRAASSQIALLRERRGALISAAVTGELDVAKAAA